MPHSYSIKYLKLIFFTAAILNIVIWVLLYFKIEPAADPILLEYSIYYGVSRIGEWWRAFLLPLLGAGILGLNSVLAIYLKKENMLHSFFFMGGALAVQIFLLLNATLLILLNTT
jgi:hypothetical protein